MTQTYSELLQQVQQAPTESDYTALRAAFAQSEYMRAEPNPALVTNLQQHVAAQDWQKILEVTQQMLAENYLDLSAHQWARAAYENLGQAAYASYHYYFAAGLLQSITDSGDGRTPMTPFRVISQNEAYNYLLQSSYQLQGSGRLEEVEVSLYQITASHQGQVAATFFFEVSDLAPKKKKAAKKPASALEAAESAFASPTPALEEAEIAFAAPVEDTGMETYATSSPAPDMQYLAMEAPAEVEVVEDVSSRRRDRSKSFDDSAFQPTQVPSNPTAARIEQRLKESGINVVGDPGTSAAARNRQEKLNNEPPVAEPAASTWERSSGSRRSEKKDRGERKERGSRKDRSSRSSERSSRSSEKKERGERKERGSRKESGSRKGDSSRDDSKRSSRNKTEGREKDKGYKPPKEEKKKGGILKKLIIGGGVLFVIAFLVYAFGGTSEDATWKRAQRLNTYKSYKAYVVNFPYGKYIKEAKGFYKSKLWDKANSSNDPKLLRLYQDEFPKDEKAKEIQNRIRGLYAQAIKKYQSSSGGATYAPHLIKMMRYLQKSGQSTVFVKFQPEFKFENSKTPAFNKRLQLSYKYEIPRSYTRTQLRRKGTLRPADIEPAFKAQLNNDREQYISSSLASAFKTVVSPYLMTFYADNKPPADAGVVLTVTYTIKRRNQSLRSMIARKYRYSTRSRSSYIQRLLGRYAKRDLERVGLTAEPGKQVMLPILYVQSRTRRSRYSRVRTKIPVRTLYGILVTWNLKLQIKGQAPVNIKIHSTAAQNIKLPRGKTSVYFAYKLMAESAFDAFAKTLRYRFGVNEGDDSRAQRFVWSMPQRFRSKFMKYPLKERIDRVKMMWKEMDNFKKYMPFSARTRLAGLNKESYQATMIKLWDKLDTFYDGLTSSRKRIYSKAKDKFNRRLDTLQVMGYTLRNYYLNSSITRVRSTRRFVPSPAPATPPAGGNDNSPFGSPGAGSGSGNSGGNDNPFGVPSRRVVPAPRPSAVAPMTTLPKAKDYMRYGRFDSKRYRRDLKRYIKWKREQIKKRIRRTRNRYRNRYRRKPRRRKIRDPLLDMGGGSGGGGDGVY